MKLIEAMKRVKLNKEKIADLQNKIQQNAANTTLDTPLYPEPRQKIDEWLQSCTDLSQECVRLVCAIQRTNLQTMAAIEVEPGLTATHSIAAWVWRRREYSQLDLKTWASLGDRGIKEGHMASTVPGQVPIEVKIVRHYNPVLRDQKASMYRSEPSNIDAALEIVNATTDLVEA